jgi:mannose-1-phosphate guanylyltransferase/phosphomannomutase
MLRSAFVSGLLSSGAKVYDFGGITLPVARRAIPFYGLDGGVHIMAINTGNEMKLVTTFLNENGADIPRDFERKIEILFMREDFTRCQPDVISEIVRFYDYKLYYMREIMNEIKDKLSVNIKIEGSDIARQLLSDLGAEIVTSDGKGVITAFVDEYAERLVLVDELGRTISGESFAALVSLISIKTGNKIIASPISGSGSIEAIAAKYNARVVRCKTGEGYSLYNGYCKKAKRKN